MAEFEPRNVNSPLNEVIPESIHDISFSTAQDECKETVEELSADVAGIGPKAAERYLLRYEYGFATKTLAEEYGVTSPAITKHTRSVRDLILQYPSLAQTVGQFRAERADLIDPVVDEHPFWEGQIDTNSTEVEASLGFYPGNFSNPYSWMFTLDAQARDDDTIRHLRVYYIIDDDYGVLLKRSLQGVSYASWRRKPHFQREWRYSVYPLPHPKIPNDDGTLINAIEHHVTFDVRKAFEKFDWQVLEMYAKSDADIERPSASLSLPDLLLDRIRRENSIDSVFDYTAETHIRDNVEHLLRLYPLVSPSKIPLKTVELLWNGSLTSPESIETTANDIQSALEASQITIEPGHRNV